MEAVAHGDHGGAGSRLGGVSMRRGFAVDLAGAEVEEVAMAALGRLPVTIASGDQRRRRPRTFSTRRHGQRCSVATPAAAHAPAAARLSPAERKRGRARGKWGGLCTRKSRGAFLSATLVESSTTTAVGRATDAMATAARDEQKEEKIFWGGEVG